MDGGIRLANHGLECGFGQFAQLAYRFLMAQQRLRREDNQRFPKQADHLPAQSVAPPAYCDRRTVAGNARCAPMNALVPGLHNRAAAASLSPTRGPT